MTSDETAISDEVIFYYGNIAKNDLKYKTDNIVGL